MAQEMLLKFVDCKFRKNVPNKLINRHKHTVSRNLHLDRSVFRTEVSFVAKSRGVHLEMETAALCDILITFLGMQQFEDHICIM